MILLLSVILASSALPGWALDQIEVGAFTLVNNLPEHLTRMYPLSRAMTLAPRGSNLLQDPLAPGDTLLVAPPSIADRFLLHDSSGNSYVVVLPDDLYDDGLVHVGTSSMSFSTFHVGGGSTPLVLNNGLEGIRVDSVSLADGNGGNLLRRHVLFPGEKLVIWVRPGTYGLAVKDQSGGAISLDSIMVPDSGTAVVVSDAHTLHLGRRWSAGEGNGLIEVKCNVAVSPLVSVRATPRSHSGQAIELTPPEPMRVHDRVLLHLEPGVYDIEAVDEDGGVYTASGAEARADTLRWCVTDADLVFDFRFD